MMNLSVVVVFSDDNGILKFKPMSCKSFSKIQFELDFVCSFAHPSSNSSSSTTRCFKIIRGNLSSLKIFFIHLFPARTFTLKHNFHLTKISISLLSFSADAYSLSLPLTYSSPLSLFAVSIKHNRKVPRLWFRKTRFQLQCNSAFTAGKSIFIQLCSNKNGNLFEPVTFAHTNLT